MPLFKPNIEKLVGKRDTNGLLNAIRWGLKHQDFDLAMRALFGLSDLHDPRAVQPLIDIALGFGWSVPYEAAVLPLFSTITHSGGAAAIRPMLEAWSEFRGLNGRYRSGTGHEERAFEMDVISALVGFSEAEILEAVYGTPSCAEYNKRRGRGERMGVSLAMLADLAVAEALGLVGGAETLRFLEDSGSHGYYWSSREAAVYDLARQRIKERLATKKGAGRKVLG